MSSYLLSQDGNEIVLIDAGEEGVRAPGQVLLHALPADWRQETP